MPHIFVNPDIFDKIERIAKENDITMSKVLETLLEGDILLPDAVEPLNRPAQSKIVL